MEHLDDKKKTSITKPKLGPILDRVIIQELAVSGSDQIRF